MKVGDYVRTKDDGIQKIKIIDEFTLDEEEIWFGTDKTGDYTDVSTNMIIGKPSPNIIDLIKKKDIVIDYNDNIYQVVKVWKGYVFTDKKNEYGQVITLVDYQIKKVITKEEFSSIGYEVSNNEKKEKAKKIRRFYRTFIFNT